MVSMFAAGTELCLKQLTCEYFQFCTMSIIWSDDCNWLYFI